MEEIQAIDIAEPIEKSVSMIESLMNNAVVIYIMKIIWAIVLILIFITFSKILARIISKKVMKNTISKRKQTDKVWKLIRDIIFYVLVIFSFFIGFEIVGFKVSLILWGISFWVWLAFKEILGNMIAGIMILYTKEFKIGDVVEVFADKKYFGRVEEITIRYTVIRTLDLRQVILPNMTLISVPIKTYSAEELIRLSTVLEVHYDADVDKAIRVITETINDCPFVKAKESTKVFFSEYGRSNIEIKAFFYIDPKSWIIPEVAIWEVNGKVSEAMEKNNIDISYEMFTLTFEDVYQDTKKDMLKNFKNK